MRKGVYGIGGEPHVIGCLVDVCEWLPLLVGMAGWCVVGGVSEGEARVSGGLFTHARAQGAQEPSNRSAQKPSLEGYEATVGIRKDVGNDVVVFSVEKGVGVT